MVLTLVWIVPAVFTLIAGTVLFREIVVSTGSVGAWDEVAGSGRNLFDQVEIQESLSPELIAATERHRAALAESVRFSRLYSFLGERVLVLLPILALLLLIFVGGLALLAANWFSRDFSRPVEELVTWTRSLTSGERLPAADQSSDSREISEFSQLRDALRATSEELRHARRKEVEQARMSSWSEMARKIAHELRNPLTPMGMAADRVSRSADPSVSAAGEVLREEIHRLETLARTFAQFGHPPDGPMSSIDLIEMLSSLAYRLSAEGMSVRFEPPKEHLFIMGHLDALERVVRNLLSNAQESVWARATMDTGDGEGRRQPDERNSEPIQIDLIPSDSGVEIRVLDRGTGIPEDVLPQIWEPEFTMKRKGTGLGLALVRQVVRTHGGEVEASNREDGGAEFLVRLPFGPMGSEVDSPPPNDRAHHDATEGGLEDQRPGAQVSAS